MIGEWSLGVGGHTQPRLLKLDAPVVQVALGDEVQAALTTQGEVYTWKLQAQHVDNVLAKWSISLPTKRSVLWDACPSRACESPFVVTISESYGLRADLWMLGFAPEVEDKKRKSKLWGALSRGKKSVA